MTYAAEYSNQSIALTGGCETIFGLISGTLYYGLYKNGEACKVTTFQGGSKRTPSVIGAGTSKDYSIAVSTSIQNGTIKLVGA